MTEQLIETIMKLTHEAGLELSYHEKRIEAYNRFIRSVVLKFRNPETKKTKVYMANEKDLDKNYKFYIDDAVKSLK